PEVTEFMVWPRLTREDEVREFLARRERDWASGSEYMWAITEPGVDVVIGGISGRPRTSDADFGYVFDRRYWNRGLATEAAAAVTSWLFSRPGVRRVWATCDVENARSIRVLEKLGLAREGLVPGGVVRPNLSSQPRDTYLYGRGA
ncbi:MAG: GNAT family N-acetyltransferase, partial [Terriglobales bacterium]